MFPSHDPIDSAVYDGTDIEQSEFYFLVNDDGTLAIFQGERQADIEGWSYATTGNTTGDKFFRITSAGNKVFFIVKRLIENQPRYMLEQLEWNRVLDASYSFTFPTPQSVITGLGDLEGRTVSVVGDGYVLKDEVVSAGQITLSAESKEIEVGIKYTCEVQTLPVVSGESMYLPKRIPRVFIDYINSLGIIVNGTLIPYLTFGDDTLLYPTPVQTEIFEHLQIRS